MNPQDRMSLLLRSLAYISRATRPVDVVVLADLLVTAQRLNGAADVTGLLAFRDGCFVQTLEGPSAAVAQTYSRILKDDRHDQLDLFYDEPIRARVYPNWAMMTDAQMGNQDLLVFLAGRLRKAAGQFQSAQADTLERMSSFVSVGAAAPWLRKGSLGYRRAATSD